MNMPKHTHVIAEMACSHDGSSDLARIIIDGAGEAGADAVQFQIWHAEDIVVPSHPALPLLRKIELPADQWRRLAGLVRERYPAMEIIACVYDERAVEFGLELGAGAFKIHAADLANPRLLRTVGATGRRVDLSIGAATLDEIQSAIEILRGAGCTEIWLMYGFQRFPTPPDAIDLRYMVRLGELFGLPVGYQDHADAGTDAAFWLPAAAVGAGARIIEKHITHDRSKRGVDHEAALNPDEFARFVGMIRLLDSAVGSGLPRPLTEEELEYRRYARKSLVAARDLQAGETLGASDLVAMRAEELGIPPDRVDELAGRRLDDVES